MSDALLKSLKSEDLAYAQSCTVNARDYRYNGEEVSSQISEERTMELGFAWSVKKRRILEEDFGDLKAYGEFHRLDWSEAKLVSVHWFGREFEPRGISLNELPLFGDLDFCFEYRIGGRSVWILSKVYKCFEKGEIKFSGGLRITGLSPEFRSRIEKWVPGTDADEDEALATDLARDGFMFPIDSNKDRVVEYRRFPNSLAFNDAEGGKETDRVMATLFDAQLVFYRRGETGMRFFREDVVRPAMATEADLRDNGMIHEFEILKKDTEAISISTPIAGCLAEYRRDRDRVNTFSLASKIDGMDIVMDAKRAIKACLLYDGRLLVRVEVGGKVYEAREK